MAAVATGTGRPSAPVDGPLRHRDVSRVAVLGSGTPVTPFEFARRRTPGMPPFLRDRPSIRQLPSRRLGNLHPAARPKTPAQALTTPPNPAVERRAARVGS